MTLRLFNDDNDDQRDAPHDVELADAVQYGDVGRVRKLVAAGSDPNSVSQRGEPLLLVAARDESEEIVSLLLDAGASPNIYNSIGASPLWFAAMFDWSNVVRQLVGCGANVNDATAEHETPLSAALQAGNWELADLLVELGGVVLAEDAYFEEMDKPYAKPNFDFQHACDQTFLQFVERLRRDTGFRFVESMNYPGVYQCDDFGAGDAIKLRTETQDAPYLLLGDRKERDAAISSWRLYPTDEKYHVLRLVAPGLNADATGADVQSLIWILVDLDQEAAFDLVGLGASYLELQFIGALNEPVEVAQRMIDLCPELRQTLGSARRLGNELAKSKRVACFWQEDQVKQHRADKS